MGGGGVPEGEMKGTRHSAASKGSGGCEGGIMKVAPSSGMWGRSEDEPEPEAEPKGVETSPLGGTGRKRVGGGGECREVGTA